MNNELQYFYLYLKFQEINAKTMQSHFKEGNKTKEWFKEWENHYSSCAFTLLEFIKEYNKNKKDMAVFNASN